MYSLFWRDPSLPFSQKQNPILVPSGQVVSNAASLRFTGKGAANYGKILQENQMRLLESFAGPTAPDYPTVGQTWFDSSESLLKVCVSTAPQPVIWRSLNGSQITDIAEPPPSPAVLGDQWFERTGSLSGFQYIYTGTGRYPQVNWIAADHDYYPSTSTTLTALPNYNSFTSENFGEAYICGFTSGVPSDVNGIILLNGSNITVPKGQLAASHPVTNGFIVWDTTGTLSTQGAPTNVFFVVRQLPDGSLQYDNNLTWVDFTPVTGMHIIGLVTNSELDDGTAPGISAITMWTETRDLKSTLSVPIALAEGAIGGWSQVYPEAVYSAGRDEYNYILNLLSQLIGSPTGFGGAGALGRSIDYLTSFSTLDASLRSRYLETTPLDVNVVQNPGLLNYLSVEPNSQDWDKLLAAVKYAVNRLEMPTDAVTSVSDLPFVLDGRPAPAVLLNKPLSDVQHPSPRRKANVRIGSITLARQYQETVNVLIAAINNRYILKGMQGTSGTNQSFNPTVAIHPHAAFSANANGSSFATTVTHGLQFNFSTVETDLQRYFTAGQAIELLIQTQPGNTPTPADTNLASVCSQYGRFRVTNDAVYVMSNSVTPSVALVPGSVGVSGLSTTIQILASATVSGAQLILRGNLVNPGLVGNDLPVLQLYVDIVAGGATTGTVFATWNLITDDETYAGSIRVFPLPANYTSTDKLGNTAGLTLFV